MGKAHETACNLVAACGHNLAGPSPANVASTRIKDIPPVDVVVVAACHSVIAILAQTGLRVGFICGALSSSIAQV